MRRFAVTCFAATSLLCVGISGSASADSAPPVTVTVHLAADAHAVAKLAHTPGLTPAQRIRDLRAALAPRASRVGVTSYLTDRGFTVVQSSPFVVRAEASPQDVAHAFGRTSTGALQVPATLAADASYVVTSNELTGVLKPLTVGTPLTGTDFRTLYDAPSGIAPTGHQSPTVATLQFSGWDDSDLSTFAADNGLVDPVASGRYKEVSVDGADPTVTDGNGGEVEVALDQESILTTAPNARQVSYFAPNSGGGIIDAIEQVATDAYNGQNIGALSISYGMCEVGLPADFLAALHQAITDAVAMGVTVFAASGDSGAYACAPGQVSVTSPADDPLVVAVGGSTLTGTPQAPLESVWWDGTNGSGGGVSTVYAEPGYQQARKPGLTGRGVPDISLDGDPDTGLVIDVDGLTGSIGGTSLATPLAAATLVDLLSSNATDYGIGFINPNLYGAPTTDFRDITGGNNGAYTATAGYDLASGLGAPRWSALRTALIGSPSLKAPAFSRSRTIPVSTSVPTGMVFSAWRISTATEPTDCGKPTSTTKPTSVTAAADGTAHIYVIGYTASGYCYVGHAKTRVDTVAPKATATAHIANTARRTARFTWLATDHSPSSGVASYRVKITQAGTSKVLFRSARTTHRSFTSGKLRRGATYVVRVSAVDAAGNRSRVAKAKVTAP